MTTQTVKIPDNKKSDFSAFVKQIGGEIVAEKTQRSQIRDDHEDDEVTHEQYFGENIKRVIRAFKK